MSVTSVDLRRKILPQKPCLSRHIYEIEPSSSDHPVYTYTSASETGFEEKRGRAEKKSETREVCIRGMCEQAREQRRDSEKKKAGARREVKRKDDGEESEGARDR